MNCRPGISYDNNDIGAIQSPLFSYPIISVNCYP
jgi:hypothetical protein